VNDASARAFELAFLAASPAAILIVHALLARALRGMAPQKVAIVAALLAGPPVVLAALQLANAISAADVLFGVLVYLSIAYSYFHLFNMSETARRIRILRELHTAGALRADQITALYGGDAVVSVRLDRLVGTGQLALRDGRYVMAGRLLYAAARVVHAWRVLLGFER